MSPDARDSFGCPLVLRATGFNTTGCLYELVRRGADLEATWRIMAQSPCAGELNAVLLASIQGRLDTLSILLRRGANPDKLSESAPSPIKEAANFGHLSAVATLLAAGADWRVFNWFYLGENNVGDCTPLLLMHGLSDDRPIMAEIFRSHWSYGWLRPLLRAHGFEPTLFEAIDAHDPDALEDFLSNPTEAIKTLRTRPEYIARIRQYLDTEEGVGWFSGERVTAAFETMLAALQTSDASATEMAEERGL